MQEFQEMYSKGGDFGAHALSILGRMKGLEEVMDEFTKKYGQVALWWILLSYMVSKEKE